MNPQPHPPISAHVELTPLPRGYTLTRSAKGWTMRFMGMWVGVKPTRIRAEVYARSHELKTR